MEIKINAIEAYKQTRETRVRKKLLWRCNMKLATVGASAAPAADTNGGNKWNDNRKLWKR